MSGEVAHSVDSGPPIEGAQAFSADGGSIGVLLLHGFTGSPASLRPWAEHLAAQGHTVRLPRLPGHGTRWQDLNKTRWADWYGTATTAFRELQQRCGVVIVAGLSMGGALGARLAEDHPNDIDGLVLVNPALSTEDPRSKVLPVLQFVLPYLPGIGDDIAKPGTSEGSYDRVPLRAVRSLVRSWSQTCARLDEVTAPSLVFRSATDHVIPASSTDRFLSGVASNDVTLVTLERSYHVATLDYDAEKIMSVTDAFIERISKISPRTAS